MSTLREKIAAAITANTSAYNGEWAVEGIADAADAILALLTPKDGEVAAVVERLRAPLPQRMPGSDLGLLARGYSDVCAEAADLLTRLSALTAAEAARPADVVAGLERAVEIVKAVDRDDGKFWPPDYGDHAEDGYGNAIEDALAALRAEIEKERAR